MLRHFARLFQRATICAIYAAPETQKVLLLMMVTRPKTAVGKSAAYEGPDRPR
jgi:hypothetical protein